MYVGIALNVTRTVNQMHHDKMKCVPDNKCMLKLP